MGTLADIPYPEALARFCEIRAYQILADTDGQINTQEFEEVAKVAGELGELGTCKPRSLLNGLSLVYRKVPRVHRRVVRPTESGLKRSVYAYWIDSKPRSEDVYDLREPESKRTVRKQKGGYTQGHAPSDQQALPLEAPAVAAPQASQPWGAPPATYSYEEKLQNAINALNNLIALDTRVTVDVQDNRVYAVQHLEFR